MNMHDILMPAVDATAGPHPHSPRATDEGRRFHSRDLLLVEIMDDGVVDNRAGMGRECAITWRADTPYRPAHHVYESTMYCF